jgi:flavin reductase (DIM6/NTAB) family NADH-FMN oxidoreductase RutF
LPDELAIDLSSLSARGRYELLNSVVVPRPIAWICTIDARERQNLAPFSYFNLCSLTPPIVHFTATSSTDSVANARTSEEFVLNIVSEELEHAMHATSTASSRPGGDGSGPDEADGADGELSGELSRAGVTALASTAVRPPRLAEAKVALECSVREILAMGEGTMVFGEVLLAHVKEVLWHDGEVDPVQLRPVGRMGGGNYATVTEVHRLR